MGVRWRTAGLAAAVMLTGCAEPPAPADDPADVELHVQHSLDAAWTRSHGSNTRPASGTVRFALPDGWGWWMQRCMVDSGFDGYELTIDGGLSNAGRPAKHTGAEGLAWYFCTKQYPEFRTVFTRVTDGALDELYDYYRAWLIPCLAATGGGGVDLPSYAEFTDGGDGQPGWWNPYLESVRPASVAAVSVQLVKCPPYPPTRSVGP